VSCAEESTTDPQIQEPEKIVLISSNADKYLAIEVTFSEFKYSITNNILHQGQYYITCNATILVKPRADYKFVNASVKVSIRNTNGWDIPNENSDTFSDSSWYKNIELDKNGYGKATVFMARHSINCEYVHPSRNSWTPKFTSASGTITIN
jgi:hypothetical protein